MTHRLACCLAIASLLFLAPRPAAADTIDVFDTVDSVDLNGTIRLFVTGILSGQTAPTTQELYVTNSTLVQQCERLALMAMSKPGKYQFHVVRNSGAVSRCKLSLRAP